MEFICFPFGRFILTDFLCLSEIEQRCILCGAKWSPGSETDCGWPGGV